MRCVMALVMAALAGSGAAQPASAAAGPSVGPASAASAPAPIVVYGDQTFAPYEFLDNGVAKGINVELFRELARRLGRPIEHRLGEWSASQAAVLAGQGDVLPPIAKTAERVQNFNFTQRLWFLDYSLFGRQADLARLERSNFNLLRIGVTAGGLARKHFQTVFPQAQLVLVSDTADGMRRVLSGEVDAYTGSLVVGRLFMADLGIRGIAPMAEPFVSLDGAIAVHKRNPALLADLDLAISQIKRDGTLDRLLLPLQGPQGVTLSQREIWAYAGAALTLMLIAVLVTTLVLQRRRSAALALELVRRTEVEARLETARQEADSARQAAEAAARAKGEFLASMSHEIRTPMNAIVGLTRMLRRAPPGAERNDDWLRKIDGAAQHLVSLVGDVLDISKIESGKLVLDEAEFTLTALVQSVSSQIGSQAQQKGLAIVIEAEPANATFLGDPTRLRQALLNLASNAVKFTSHGSVTLRAHVQAEHADVVTLLLECRDTGPGLSPEFKGRVFEAFEQGSTGTTRSHGGTGLGLSITKRLALLMGGQVGVDSELGLGSRFWFTAQVLRGHDVAYAGTKPDGQRAAQVLRDHYTGARVLVAEDNEINLAVTRHLLEEAGLVVIGAVNGQEAVERVAADAFDLVLMDMQMPVMDGMAATMAIRRTHGSEQLPILALTANAFDEDRRACSMVGMNAFLTKPVDPDLLYEKVLGWLQRSRRVVPPEVPPLPAVTPPIPPAAGVRGRQQQLSALARVEGLDVDSGMRNCLGQHERYMNLLDRFLADALEVLGAALQRADPADGAAAQLHRLRGAALTLGFVGLAARYGVVEQALKASLLDAPQARQRLEELLTLTQQTGATLQDQLNA